MVGGDACLLRGGVSLRCMVIRRGKGRTYGARGEARQVCGGILCGPEACEGKEREGEEKERRHGGRYGCIRSRGRWRAREKSGRADHENDARARERSGRARNETEAERRGRGRSEAEDQVPLHTGAGRDMLFIQARYGTLSKDPRRDVVLV